MTTTEFIKSAFCAWSAWRRIPTQSRERSEAQFDAWFAEEIRKAKEAAYDEGKLDAQFVAVDNPYRLSE
jgi:hypothetical protein